MTRFTADFRNMASSSNRTADDVFEELVHDSESEMEYFSDSDSGKPVEPLWSHFASYNRETSDYKQRNCGNKALSFGLAYGLCMMIGYQQQLDSYSTPDAGILHWAQFLAF